MARTTIEDCLDEGESHFDLAYQAARRARELMRRGDARVDELDDKPVVVALRETAEHKSDGDGAGE